MEDLSVNSFFSLEEPVSVFTECTYPWQALLRMNEYFETCLLGKIEGDVSQFAFLINPELISIGKGTVVEAGAYIAGPCVIGENCQIRNGAYIRGNAIIGNDCVIGHATEVKNSIFLNRVCAGHFNYVGDSILGNDVNLGAGVVCANLRLDRKLITIRFNNQKIPTSLKKLGAIIGDSSQIGCNSVLNPGTVLGKKVFVAPCLNISGYIPAGSIIKDSLNKIS